METDNALPLEPDPAPPTEYIEPPPAPSYGQSQVEARLAGYGWQEIDDHLADRSRAALAEGYGQTEIDDFLGRGRPEAAAWRMNAEWRTRLANDETLASGLPSASTDHPLTPLDGPAATRMAAYAGTEAPATTMPPPDYIEPPAAGTELNDAYLRGSYVRALLADEIRSPRDFAERYTGALWGADDRLDGPALVRAANGLSDTLPSDRDFTDQAIAIAHSRGVALTPENVQVVKTNLADAWAESGEPLMGLYRRAYFDAEFGQALTQPPQADPAEAVARTVALPIAIGEFWKGAGFAATHSGEEIKARVDAGEVSAPEALGLGLTRVPAGMVEGMWTAARRAGEAMMGGQPLTPEEAINAAAIGVTGSIVRGRPMARVIDPEAAPGQALKELPGPQAFEVPAPAERAPVKAAAEGQPSAPVSPLDFAPEAKPAAKMQSLAQAHLEQRAEVLEDLRLRNEGILPDEFSDPHFFQKLAAGQDAPTQELARGMDTGRGILRYVADLGGDLMRDESGGLKMFKTPAETQAEAVRTSARDYVQDLIRREQGRGAREMSIVAHTLDPATRRLGALLPETVRTKALAADLDNAWARVNPHMKEWETEVGKGPAGNPMGTMVGNMIEFVEGRSIGATIRADSPLKPVADSIRQINLFTRVLMEQAEKDGLHTLTGYYNDYFRHLWKDPNKADRVFGVGGRLGSSASFKLRSIPTVADGLAAGLEPAIMHPLELTLTDAAQKIKYLHALRIKQEGIDAGHFYWATKPVDAADIRLHGPGTERPIPGSNSGAAIEHLYGNRGAATPWNDWVNIGFYSRPGTASMYDKLLFAKNTTVGLSLAGPVYHLVAMSGEAVTSAIGKGLQEIGGGVRLAAQGKILPAAAEFGRAARDITLGATIVPEVIRQARLGHREMAKFRSMVNDPVINALAEAGAWVGPRQEIYKMGSAPNFLESIVRRELGRDYAQQLKRIVERDPNGDISALQVGGRSIGFLGREIGRVMTTVSAPLFDFLIPRLKVAANVEQMQTYLRQHPNVSPEQRLEAARRIVDNTDSRLGEMNMDNIFWPRLVKQLAQVAMISPAWVYGYARMVTRAGGINMERMRLEASPVDARNLLAFTVTTAGLNTIYQYFMTGQMPWSTDTPLHDIIAPRSGGRDPKTGAPERGLIPGQMKEALDYARIAMVTHANPTKFGEALWHYMQNKLPPYVQMGRAFVTGEDPIGHHVTTGTKTYLDYALRSVTPIIYQTPKDRKKDTGIPEWQNWMLGIRPAMPHVANPNEFLRQQEWLDHRYQREDYRRAVRENKNLETPRPLPAKPETASDRAIRQERSRRARDPRWNPRGPYYGDR